jgi:7-cyano-7-deazaguanine synthase
MNKVVLLSGGVDSTTCLAMAVARYGADKVTALTFLYGQKHSNELQNARNVAKHLGVELVEAEVSRQIFQGSKSTLLQGNGDISHESYADILAKNGEGVVDTYVPFRNGLMLSQAAALAYSKDADEVWYGAHSDDAAGSAYPDCTPEFYAAMDQAIFQGTGHTVHLLAPLLNLNKAQVVAAGLKINAPYELTRSCYEGHEYACGKCATCIDRLHAFEVNGVTDPVQYERN